MPSRRGNSSRGISQRLLANSTLSPGSFAKAVRLKTGIDRFHAHHMRHPFACQWLERGGSLDAPQQILGHASIVTTQRYAKLTDEVFMRETMLLSERKRSQLVAQTDRAAVS